MPENFRAELIGGIVYVPSPLKSGHGSPDLTLSGLLFNYITHTPGISGFDNATGILGPDSEPQPDISLIIEGGQTRMTADDYLKGPPELIAEIASSSAAYDLHTKRRDYERYGVGEYLVVLVRESRLVWFVRPAGPKSGFTELAAGADGIYRSPLFPGLWIDAAALVSQGRRALLEVLDQGLGTPEHAAFVAARRK